jgi:F0F1-type ATP synthase assembly protein I
MYSLAHLVLFLMILAALIGSAIGCGIGWFVSRRFGFSKLWPMLIGGILGLPAGAALLPLVIRALSLIFD